MSSDDVTYGLSDEEIRVAQKIINEAKPGRYTLKQLFGTTRWDAIGTDGDKRDYGARFKYSYLAHRFRGIEEAGHKSFSVAYLVM